MSERRGHYCVCGYIDRLPPEQWDGYRRHTRSRKTGTTIVLVEAERQNIDADDGGRWALVCDDHGSILQADQQANLWTWAAHSEEWCNDCRKGVGA